MTGFSAQWRGYGSDGGYAIVFETDGLQQLLDEEFKSFHYQVMVWGEWLSIMIKVLAKGRLTLRL